MFTKMQQKLIAGLAKVESKNYTTSHIVQILKQVYQELRGYSDEELEESVTASLYQQ